MGMLTAHYHMISRERVTMIKGIDIAAYLVKDPQAAIAFYRDVLGIQPT